MTDDISTLLPRDKLDEDNAEAIIKLGYPAIEPVLPQLLEWLQDFNWPVAQVLAPGLARIGTPIIPHVRRILHSNDTVWISWILELIVAPSPELAEALRDELSRLATNATPAEKSEELHIIAQEILDSLGEK